MIHLLVIDDDSSVRSLLQKILERNCYKVSLAESAAAAFTILKGTEIDLIILDVIMPETNGYTFCRQLKDDELLKDIPVIFLTAESGSEALLQAYECGGVDFIEKPIHRGALLLRLESHLAHVDSRKKIQAQHEELKRYQALLVQEEKTTAVARMVGGLSHELNNPLSCIRSNFQSLEKYLKKISEAVFIDDEENESAAKVKKALENSREILRESEEELQQVKEITSRLVTLDLPEGEAILYCANEAVLNSCLLHSDRLKGIKVDYRLCSNEVKVLCHPAALSQCLYIIIENAIQAFSANDDDKKILINSFFADEKLIISISDNGCGMDDETQSKIFDPFFTTKEVGSGTGLGLSSVMQKVSQMKGSVKVCSQKNEGSEFIITLPAVEESSGW